MSHAPKTRSSSCASGTKSLISGDLLSVRLPSRMVPIWVREPIGLASPRRTASTPAIIVVATAPKPTTITPSFPVAGATFSVAVFLPPSFAVDIVFFNLPLTYQCDSDEKTIVPYNLYYMVHWIKPEYIQNFLSSDEHHRTATPPST